MIPRKKRILLVNNLRQNLIHDIDMMLVDIREALSYHYPVKTRPYPLAGAAEPAEEYELPGVIEDKNRKAIIHLAFRHLENELMVRWDDFMQKVDWLSGDILDDDGVSHSTHVDFKP